MHLRHLFVFTLVLSFSLSALTLQQKENENAPLDETQMSIKIVEEVYRMVSKECQDQVQKANGNQNEISSECRQEIETMLSKAMSEKLNTFKSKEEEKKKPEKREKTNKKTKTSKKDQVVIDPVKKQQAAMAITAFLVAVVVGLLGLCWYVNKEITDSGIYSNSKKKLSKKKLEKQKRKEQVIRGSQG